MTRPVLGKEIVEIKYSPKGHKIIYRRVEFICKVCGGHGEAVMATKAPSLCAQCVVKKNEERLQKEKLRRRAGRMLKDQTKTHVDSEGNVRRKIRYAGWDPTEKGKL